MRVCTIVAKNYLAHARVLADSFRQHNPDGGCTVLVIDGTDGHLDPADESFDLVTPRDIGVDDFDLMAGIYDIVELSTAVKPWLLHALLHDDEHVAYLDPDIEVFDRFDELEELIANHRLVLTPHTTEPLPEDGKRPSQTDILLAGAYNLGFIGIGRGKDADRLLDWWSERLRKDSRNAPDQGLFVDQRWIDLVPGIVSDHFILRDPGYNLAYWNLPGRRLERRDSGYSVNGRPLRFFHFSGYDPDDPRRLSKHQDRISLSDEPVLRELCDRYAAKLRERGYGEVRRWPYGLDRMADGSRLDPESRSLYRNAIEQGAVRRSIFTPEGAADFRQWQRGPAAGWGVNLIGYLRSEMGVGEAARHVHATLAEHGVPVHPVIVSSPHHREEHAFEAPAGEADHPVNLVCINADALPDLASEESLRRQLQAHYSIGLWWWELSRFPAALNPAFDLLDEVWVGSEHVAEALRTTAPVPVRKVVLPVTPPEPPPLGRERLGLSDGYLFLYVWDYRGRAERKNPLGAVQAFVSAFEPGDGARLALKCVNSDAAPEAHARLREAIAGRPDIALLDGYVSAEEKNAMIASCDCYVSLHRSEGFGLTLAEAMYYGRPAIATGYSGNLEYMTAENSMLVDYELRQVGEGSDPYPPDAIWAEPDHEHAARLMRRAFEQPEEAAELGHRAAADLRRLHSLDAAGRNMEQLLRGLRPAQRRSRLVAVEGDDPSARAARAARNRVIVGPPKRARTRFGGPIRNLVLRLMRPWTSHQADVDLMLLNAIDQLNVAMRELEPVRQVAEGWRSLPSTAGLELETFDHPLAGRVSGYRAPGAEAPMPPGPPLEEPERLVLERRRPYAKLLSTTGPVLDAGCGRGELLDVLRAESVEASGVEPSPEAAEAARAKGHQVTQAEVDAHLAGLEDGSLGAIFSAAALRRPLPELVRFLALARVKLRPGGQLVLESANPHSTEALKAALAQGEAAPLAPEVALVLCRGGGFAAAFAWHPQGSGDVERDRYRALQYAVAAGSPVPAEKVSVPETAPGAEAESRAPSSR